MQDQRAALEPQQQVLGPASRRQHALPGDRSADRRADWPSQAPLAQNQLIYPSPAQGALYAAASGLDFGKFGHGLDERFGRPVPGDEKPADGGFFDLAGGRREPYLILASL
jgi:hypothetical protein